MLPATRISKISGKSLTLSELLVINKKNMKNPHPKIGKPPGTIEFVGKIKVETPQLSVLNYDKDLIRELPGVSLEESLYHLLSPDNTWLSVVGIHNVELIKKIGSSLKIHPIILEDIVNTSQRQKIEFFDDYIFTIIKIPSVKNHTQEANFDQLGLLLGENYLISFWESENEVVQNIKSRLLKIGNLKKNSKFPFFITR